MARLAHEDMYLFHVIISTVLFKKNIVHLYGRNGLMAPCLCKCESRAFVLWLCTLLVKGEMNRMPTDDAKGFFFFSLFLTVANIVRGD